MHLKTNNLFDLSKQLQKPSQGRPIKQI